MNKYKRETDIYHYDKKEKLLHATLRRNGKGAITGAICVAVFSTFLQLALYHFTEATLAILMIIGFVFWVAEILILLIIMIVFLYYRYNLIFAYKTEEEVAKSEFYITKREILFLILGLYAGIYSLFLLLWKQ